MNIYLATFIFAFACFTACTAQEKKLPNTSAKKTMRKELKKSPENTNRGLNGPSTINILNKKLSESTDPIIQNAVIVRFGDSRLKGMRKLVDSSRVRFNSSSDQQINTISISYDEQIPSNLWKLDIHYVNPKNQTGTYLVQGHSLFKYKASMSMDDYHGSTEGLTEIGGTIEIIEESDSHIKGTAVLAIPLLNEKGSMGSKVQDSFENFKIEASFYFQK